MDRVVFVCVSHDVPNVGAHVLSDSQRVHSRLLGLDGGGTFGEYKAACARRGLDEPVRLQKVVGYQRLRACEGALLSSFVARPR
jgi:hypothetical protein